MITFIFEQNRFLIKSVEIPDVSNSDSVDLRYANPSET